MAEETTIESLQAELAGAKARIAELNSESAGHRLNAKNVRAELDAAVVKHADELKSFGEKLTVAEKTAKDAGERSVHVLRDAALKLAAKDAGIVDLDGLKLLDTTAVKVGEDGTVSIPDKFFAKAKEAKPYLFSQTGAQTGTTASTAKAPPASDTGPKDAKAMSSAEYAAAKAALLRA